MDYAHSVGTLGGTVPGFDGWLTALNDLTGFLAAHAIPLTVGTIAGWVTLRMARAIIRLVATRRARRNAFTVTLRPPPEADLASAQAWWRHLLGVHTSRWRRVLFGQPHLGWEYRWTGRRMSIVVWTPAGVPPTLIADAAKAAWPGTSTTIDRATAPLPAAGRVRGGRLRLARDPRLPVLTEHDTDPLRAVLAAAGDARDNEHSVVQILARPAHTHPSRKRQLARTLLDVLDPQTSRHAKTSAARRDPVQARQVRAATDKAVEPAWDICVRYAAATHNLAPHRRDRARLSGRAHALASAFAVYTGHNALRRRRVVALGRMIAGRAMRSPDQVSTSELAALAHFPLDDTVPELDRARARPIPAPVHGTVGGRDRKRLGRSVTGRTVTVPVVDARQHMHVVGATGSGKSTLLANTALGEAAAHRAVVVIDPKGDLVDDILDRLPATAADRLVLIDPRQPSPGPAFNPLHVTDPKDAGVAVDQLCGIFARVFGRFWGPRADDALRSACLTLMRHHGANLSLITPLFSDRRTQAELTVGLDDPEGLLGFWDWFGSLQPSMQAQVVGPVLARLRAFLLRDFVKHTVGGQHTTVDFRRLLDTGGILLVRIPKGALGEDTCKLLGSMLVAQIWQAATARTDIPADKRRDATLIVDECHNFLNMPRALDEMLAEARGYRLSLVLAHQNLAQLPKEMQAALSANARNKILFAVSPEDAHQLARHTAPHLSDWDLTHPDAYTAAAKLIIDGTDTHAFTLRTDPPADIAGHATLLRTTAAERARADTEKAQARSARHAQTATRRTGNPRTGPAVDDQTHPAEASLVSEPAASRRRARTSTRPPTGSEHPE